MLLGLTALTALFVLVAPWVIGLFGDPGTTQRSQSGCRGCSSRSSTLLGVSGIIVGILNSYDHFTVPAISPVFWNLAIIVGLVIGVPQADGDEHEALRLRRVDPRRDVIQVLLPMPWLRGPRTSAPASCSTGATRLSARSSS